MAIVSTILAILLSGIVQATGPWYTDIFYIARDSIGNPLSAYVKGDTITLSLENELDYQTVYTQYVGKVKSVDTGKVVKSYTKLPSRIAIPFGGTYTSTWIANVPGRYQACAIVINGLNQKKERCTQIFKVFSKPTAELTIITFAKSYNTGKSIPFGITGTGTLPVYLDTAHYTVISVDTGTPYVLNVNGYLLEKMDGGGTTYIGFDWDQKVSGVQVASGRYKFRWYWGDNPNPAPKNKYSDSAIFTIK